MADKPGADPISDQLRALAEELAATFKGRMAAIDTIYTELEADIWPRQARQDLRTVSHTLAGTAGSFGYLKISQAARDVVNLLPAMADNDQHPADDVRQSLALALQTLRDELASPVAEEGWL